MVGCEARTSSASNQRLLDLMLDLMLDMAHVLLPISQSPLPTPLQVGFRQAELRDRQLLHNGQPVLLKGVNRHEHDDRRGKTVSLGDMEGDVRLMKQLNFNAVRCSHYPNHPLW